MVVVQRSRKCSRNVIQQLATAVLSFLAGILVGRISSMTVGIDDCYHCPGQLLQQAQKKTADTPHSSSSDNDSFESYDLKYQEVTVKNHQYFLPQYALDRPATQMFLQGEYFEDYTHKAVDALLQEFPGSMVHAGTFFGDMLPHFSSVLVHCQQQQQQQEAFNKHSHFWLYAFEPNTKNYILAQKAVEANSLSNVILINAALGKSSQLLTQARIATTNGRKEFGGASSVKRGGNQRVPLIAIDMIQIENLSILQLDIEGYERQALEGAIQTIRRERPILAVEDRRGDVQKLLDGEQLNDLEYKSICSEKGVFALVWYATPDIYERVKTIVRSNKACSEQL